MAMVSKTDITGTDMIPVPILATIFPKGIYSVSLFLFMTFVENGGGLNGGNPPATSPVKKKNEKFHTFSFHDFSALFFQPTLAHVKVFAKKTSPNPLYNKPPFCNGVSYKYLINL